MTSKHISLSKTKSVDARLCAFHIDLNFVHLRSEYIRRWLPLIAEMGYNAILWETEDKVCWETCPEVAWPEAITKSVFRSLLDDTAALGMESIPLLQTIGHAEYVLQHEAHRHMRELPDRHDCYCTENPATRVFLGNLIREMLDLFGSPRRFHLGGDEAYVFGQCPKCAAQVAAVGEIELYARHLTELSRPLRDARVVPAVWSDMILANASELDGILDGFEIWDWNYWCAGQSQKEVRVWGHGTLARSQLSPAIIQCFPQILGVEGALNGFYTADFLRDKGYSVVLCGSARSAGDSFFCPQTRLHDFNIAAVAAKAARSGLTGIGVTSWGIRLNSWETQWISLALGPIFLLEPEADVQHARASVAESLFGVEGALILEAIDQISGQVSLFAREKATGVQWNGLKDSLPAPSGHVEQCLRRIRKENRLETEILVVEDQIQRIKCGLVRLEELAARVTTGRHLFDRWVMAAEFQYLHARITRDILKGSHVEFTVDHLEKLRHRYLAFLRFDQTNGSAEKNAGLVYDALIAYKLDKLYKDQG